MTSNVLRWRWWWLRPQFRDEPQNLLEHLPWDGDLGHLEDNIAAVAHYLRADLDQLVLQTRQRPVLDRLRCCKRAEKSCQDCRRAHEAGAARRWPRTFCTTAVPT